MKKAAIVTLVILVVIVVSAGSIAYFVSQPAKGVRIVLSGVVIDVELATTAAAQEKGLSGRDSMSANHGMLFVFDSENYWGFWMHEMRFPLDIVWFDSNRRAIFFEQRLQPCTPNACPVFTPTAKAMYVLEVNAGFVATHNVLLGDTFSFAS